MSLHLRPSSSRGKQALATVCLLLALPLLPACSAGGSDGPGSDSTLIINTSFVYKTLDPGRVYEQTGYVAVHALYSTMMTFEGKEVTEPQPLLAESVEPSKDGKTFTFQLRDDATFSDGTPVEAEDVVFSINRMKNLQSGAAPFFADLTVTAEGEGTVVVTSVTPDINVPVLMTMPATSVVNSEVATENGAVAAADAATTDSAQSAFDTASAGSGPYVLERNDPGSEMVLTRNEEYWGEQPGYERVVIRNMDIQNQKLTLERSTAHEVALDVAGAALNGLDENLNVSSTKDTLHFAMLNTDPAVSPVSSNPAFVQALRTSIDYEGLAALYGEGGGRIGGYVAEAYPGALPEDEAPEQDLDLARTTLADAGLNKPSVRFIYPAITFRGVDLGTIATKIKGDAAQAGIDLELAPLPLTSFLEEYRGGSAEMVMSPQALSYPRADNLVQVFSPGGTNAARVNWMEGDDAEVTKLAQRVYEATSDDERDQALRDWQVQMRESSPVIALSQNSGTAVSTPSVAGAEYTPAGWLIDVPNLRPAS